MYLFWILLNATTLQPVKCRVTEEDQNLKALVRENVLLF
jgi:hypothetical protein